MSIAWQVQSKFLTTADGWKVRRVGDLVNLTNGFPFPSDSFSPSGDIPLVRIRDLANEPFDTFVTERVPKSCLIDDGDVVIGMDGDFNLSLWNRGQAALNQRLCVLRSKGTVDIRFIAYALPSALKIINDLTFSTTVKHLSSADILSERLMIPSLEEQRRVADFLDGETRRIDLLRTKLVSQINLLQTRRQIRIMEAVGDTAADTRARRLHSMAEVSLGRQRSPQNAEGPHMVPYLRAANVKDGKLDLDDVLSMNFSPSEQQIFALRPGDVLVTEGSGSLKTVGASAVWNAQITGTMCFQNTLLRIRPRSGLADGSFLEWWARSAFASGKFAAITTGANIFHISAERVRSLPTAFPPIEDQQRIARCLSMETMKFETLIALRERQLQLLAERRQALITAAVTGQVDVSTASGRNVTD